MSERIDRLARRVAADPFFLGAALADYARSEQLDDAGLAAALGCSPETLSLVRLCRRPRLDLAGFREDVELIAARFALDPTVLAEMVRRAEVLATLRADEAATQGTLIAARDRREPRPTHEVTEEPKQ